MTHFSICLEVCYYFILNNELQVNSQNIISPRLCNTCNTRSTTLRVLRNERVYNNTFQQKKIFYNVNIFINDKTSGLWLRLSTDNVIIMMGGNESFYVRLYGSSISHPGFKEVLMIRDFSIINIALLSLSSFFVLSYQPSDIWGLYLLFNFIFFYPNILSCKAQGQEFQA